jgi:dTDP-4-dehydrorhamnose reductase
MKILGTGLSGMVGSYVVKKLTPEYEFENLSLETGVDITKPEVVDQYLRESPAPWVLHFAAITDVDAAEKEKDRGNQSKTWSVNVQATESLVQACTRYNKKLLYISTDFVFHGGDKQYTESDIPDPIGWYATTKYEGEKRVQTLGESGVIVRISFPYGPVEGPKKDFVGKLRERFEQKEPITAPIDQIFVPTCIDDIATGISLILRSNVSGIYHVVGSECLSSYNAALTIADVFEYDKSLVHQTTAQQFYAGRAPRAFQLRVSNDRIRKLGLVPHSFRDGLALY